jgi:hypothetical protein
MGAIWREFVGIQTFPRTPKKWSDREIIDNWIKRPENYLRFRPGWAFSVRARDRDGIFAARDELTEVKFCGWPQFDDSRRRH